MQFFRRPQSGHLKARVVSILVACLLGLLVPVIGGGPVSAQSQGSL